MAQSTTYIVFCTAIRADGSRSDVSNEDEITTDQLP